MRILVVVTNIFVFLEETSVIKQLGLARNRVYYTINPNYVKSRTTKDNLIHDINRLNLGLEYITWGRINDSTWDVMLCSSYAGDGTYDKLVNTKVKVNVLVEDGSYDYFTENVSHPDFVRGKNLFLFRPQNSVAGSIYRSVRPIKIDADIQRRIMSLYSDQLNVFNRLPNGSCILFTSPLESDFGIMDHEKQAVEFMEKNFRNQVVVLKKHPRDLSEYKSRHIDIVECSTNVPGQILDILFNGPKVFTFPSTICFMSGKVNDMLLLRMKTHNKSYNDFYEKVGRLNCFRTIMI